MDRNAQVSWCLAPTTTFPPSVPGTNDDFHLSVPGTTDDFHLSVRGTNNDTVNQAAEECDLQIERKILLAVDGCRRNWRAISANV